MNTPSVPNAFFRCRACRRDLFVMHDWPDRWRSCNSGDLEPITPEEAPPLSHARIVRTRLLARPYSARSQRELYATLAAL